MVPSAFVVSLTATYTEALRLMEAALVDCPDELWRTDLWPDAPTGPGPYGGLRGSAPWFLGYHALSCLDYDLAAELEPWSPPAPFDDVTYSYPNRVFTQAELLGYVELCRARVEHTLALVDERAEAVVPVPHRRAGMRYAQVIGNIPLHVVEHGAQIRQFLTASGVTVRPLPGDQGYQG